MTGSTQATQTAKALAKERATENTTGPPEGKTSISYDRENRPFVTVEEDILDGVPREDWIKTVKDNLREKFPDGVTVGNSEIKINAQSREEMTFSKYMQHLMRTNTNLFADKLRATNNADEILRAAQNWVNEALLHPRKDSIQEFARGDVLLQIGGQDYTAQVIVGSRGNGNLLLYDIINLTETRIQERTKKSDTARITHTPKGFRNRRATSDGASITQDSGDVKKKFSMRLPVEETEKLLALHNLTSENLADALELGGLPMPSIAVVRADDPDYTADQIMRHEAGHDRIAKGEIDPAEVRARLREKYSGAEIQALGALYAQLYSGTGLSAEEIWEEVICDSLGDMNAFSETAVSGFVEEMLGATRQAAQTQETAQATERTTGPPGEDPTLAGKIRQSIPQMQESDIVATVTGEELPQGGRIVDRLAGYAAKIGNKANRPGFGDVLISKGKIKNSMIGHGTGQAKIDTFAAVPSVIERGVQIDYQQNWKGRSYDTYLFAAPVSYKGSRTYLGVLVAKDSQSSRYYLHEVVDEQGNIIFQNNNPLVSSSDGTSALSGDLDTVSDTRGGTATIPQKGSEVKKKFSMRLSDEETDSTLKSRQWAIVQESNPAEDSIHTWVRSAEEIKTFQETLNDPDWSDGSDFGPDYTWEMAQEAAERGEIRVYSSDPIAPGAFVTPSRMEAESYSGNRSVHERTVNLTDVAWIDPTQGQYTGADSSLRGDSSDVTMEKSTQGGTDNGRTRKESRAAFLRRATGEGYGIIEGDTAVYGFRRLAEGQSARQNAGQVQEELKALGINADIIADNVLLRNKNGLTTAKIISQAATVGGEHIFISDGASVSPRNAAGHEAFSTCFYNRNW